LHFVTQLYARSFIHWKACCFGMICRTSWTQPKCQSQIMQLAKLRNWLCGIATMETRYACEQYSIFLDAKLTKVISLLMFHFSHFSFSTIFSW
jgi:hypothetical protein